ncbi:MAG: DNA-binding protein WhiA [Oscillospiraceae bacterium]|jgi:DNA-binding protein WhiA|nr:DNA-binding protein WhiA [Oscillospiraceae bacterium]
MSFSSETKAELCRQEILRKCCAQAECYGILLYANRFGHREARIITESADLAARLPILFKRAFHITFDRLPEEESGKRVFSVTDPDKLSQLWAAFGYDPGTSVAHHINFAVLEEDHCRAAFFRGAFLAGGSVTDPSKSYHLELTTTHRSVDRELLTLLREAGFDPKSADRGGVHMAYFKRSEDIADLLTAMGAPLAAMELMNAKAEKDLRGGVNRRVNCDAHNLDKAVDAAQAQLEVIRRLSERMDLSELPPKLAEAAKLRLDNPDLTLTELSALCQPPITKSSLSHRLKKLGELVEG